MKKAMKSIGKVMLYTFLAFVVFLTCCLLDNYVDNIQRGYSQETAQKYAQRRVEEMYIDPICNWLESVTAKRKEIVSYPIANWNISWDTLVKPGQ